ncbi:tRNA-i(6)A37 thiotransferase enzyme MiaB [Orenia metallireducens]|jgi:tRNA-2-methylthio-N6-dimethylallyladenosine synthase|uniref:tRNA-2-methylthio-N(6)-dimethylallyladenosine synthase n=1 Tax=Orenia metallireducens TaxID=1413210 RepID=A0A285HTI0_9FIRM|nr:tRNA (N6-isopentenyl adenosine(37)-C2)-methylthiotransferase MiaB [Orenia metallireducens]PRX24085.1 tRNA-i(6)A37 thiotransferase enzyme MiaB [Orenia metallireducens]SNY38987.1 tRNA-i(6)A37 thiotransferase enzyme MiaB [Orenia metallireducens]
MTLLKDKKEHRGFYLTVTYGCQMNEHDSEKLAGVLEGEGYHPTEELTEADIIILNTCCVRENAELKVYGKVGQLKRLKEKNPDLIIGICGCMMQQEEVVNEIKAKYRHVDIVFGTHNIHHFPKLLKQAKEQKNPLVQVWDENTELIPDMPVQRTDDHRAWVTTIYGCNNFCTYCIVPYVRGREKSRPVEDIVREVEELAADGVKEVTLLGQNVNSYGNDFEDKTDFTDLLTALNEVEGLARIRFMTAHPKDCSDRLIEAVANLDKVCDHFHLPVQAGSNKVLKAMNRNYTREEYIDLIERVRAKNPNASISTDVIVGFPGESEEDFQATLDLFEKVEYDMAYSFMYSKRTGTPAAKMEEQVPDDVKNDRLQRLIDLQSSISMKNNQPYLNQTVEVLVEGESKNNPETLTGRTTTNKIVIFEGDTNLTGQLVNVKINKVQSWTLYGTIVD